MNKKLAWSRLSQKSKMLFRLCLEALTKIAHVGLTLNDEASPVYHEQFKTVSRPLSATAIPHPAFRMLRDALILAAAAAILSLPALVHGPLPVGSDTHEHLNFSRHFADQFWTGELYPRWLSNMNHGLGSPSFFVFPPFPSYLVALLRPAGKLLHFNPFNAGEFLCLYCSGISAFLWLGTMASRRISLIVAGLYMLLPYHLSIDFYRRTALPESWALAWMPLVLYFTVRAIDRKPGSVVGLAVAYALLIISHLISVLMFSPVLVLLALLFAEPGKRARAWVSIALGMLWGTGLSAFYLLSALVESKYFPAAALRFPLLPNMLLLGRGLFDASSETYQFIRAISLVTIDVWLFIVFCSFLALRKSPATRRKQVLFWLAMCIIPLFMMSRFSLPVWSAFPFLINSIQFPFRFGTIICVAALPAAAFSLSDFSWPISFKSLACLAVLFLFIGSWVISYARVVELYSEPAMIITGGVSEWDGWFRAWRPTGMDEGAALQDAAGPQARFIEGDGSVTVTSWSARRVELQTDCAACGPVMINQLYFPAWRAELLPGAQPLQVQPAMPPGLIEVRVPPGSHRVLIDIPRSRSERLGDWITAVCALMCFALYPLGRSYRWMRAASGIDHAQR